jgi:hypothetical protein
MHKTLHLTWTDILLYDVTVENKCVAVSWLTCLVAGLEPLRFNLSPVQVGPVIYVQQKSPQGRTFQLAGNKTTAARHLLMFY